MLHEAFDKDATIAFSMGSEKIHVGHFIVSYSTKMACDSDGFALVDKGKVSEGETNNSLQKYQWGCNGAGADLIKAGGKIYVDAWQDESSNPQSVLLQLENNKFKPVCRIRPKRTYKPASVLQSQPSNDDK